MMRSDDEGFQMQLLLFRGCEQYAHVDGNAKTPLQESIDSRMQQTVQKQDNV